MSTLNFRSLIGNDGIVLDDTNPDSVEISGTSMPPFDLVNTYYMAINGNNSNSGKSISEPKATLQGASGIIANITNPTARNLINVLDGASYAYGSPLIIPSSMNLTINAPPASFQAITTDLFQLGEASRFYLYCNNLQTNSSYKIISTASNSLFHIYVNNILSGQISNLNYTFCKLYVSGNFHGSISTLPSEVSVISGYILGENTGAITGGFVNEPYVMPVIRYSTPSVITSTQLFCGKTIVTDSSVGSAYTINLTNDKFSAGSYFYVNQLGNDPIIFSASGGALLLSDQSSAFVKTRVNGSLIRVTALNSGVNTLWSISGDLTFV